MLKIENLSTYYYSDKQIIKALDSVNFEIGAAEFTGLAGPSGCGKSTLGFSIMRLIYPPGKIVGGSIKFDGIDLLKLKLEQMINIRGSKISIIFQDPFTYLNPVITIGEQIAETMRFHYSLDKNDAKTKAIELLAKTKIDDPLRRYNQYPHELSGGMRQRVMIAIAISQGSKLLIADEPTTALDVTTQAHIMELLKELNEKDKIAILLISHNITLIRKYCKKTYFMEEGKISSSRSDRGGVKDKEPICLM